MDAFKRAREQTAYAVITRLFYHDTRNRVWVLHGSPDVSEELMDSIVEAVVNER